MTLRAKFLVSASTCRHAKRKEVIVSGGLPCHSLDVVVTATLQSPFTEKFMSYFHVLSNESGLESDMRFHVLGLGPVGQLVAFHLRRNLSSKHVVSLMFKHLSLANRFRDYPLHIEYDGVISSIDGFQTESTNLLGGRKAFADIPGTPANSGNFAPSKSRQSTEKDPDEKYIESLFVTCKAQSTLSAIQQVQHRLSASSTVVLLQNGNLSAHELLLEKIFREPSDRPNFILVSNSHGIWLKRAPFHIVHAGIGQLRFSIVPDGRRDFEKSLRRDKPRLSLDDIAVSRDDPDIARYRSLRNTVAVLQKLVGLQSMWVPYSEMQVLLRQKLTVNCVINPLTAILGCRNGEIYAHEMGKRLVYRICKEASRVFKEEAIANREPGVNPEDVFIPHELSLEGLTRECYRVARITGSNTSSMLADLKKGKKDTEVEYLNGHLMKLGKRYSVPVPVNASMLDLVKMRAEIPLDAML